MKVKKMPSGKYHALLYDYTDPGGKRHYKSITMDSKSEVLAAAAQWKDEKRNVRSDMVFRDAASAYIDAKRTVLSPATVRGYQNIIKAMSEESQRFYFTNLSRIDSRVMQTAVNEWSIEHKGKTVRNRHGLATAVMAFFGYASPPVKLPQMDEFVPNTPTDEDIRNLLEYTRGTELYIPILLAATGTLRRGEICGAGIDDLSGNTLHVAHSKVQGDDGKYHLKQPKNRSSDRFVELPEFVVKEIRKRGRITTLSPHSITVQFDRALRHLGIEHFRFHDLRAYSASIAHALGVPDAYIMARGGWSSQSTLDRIYRRALDDRQQEMTDRINKYFDENANEMQTKKIKPLEKQGVLE